MPKVVETGETGAQAPVISKSVVRRHAAMAGQEPTQEAGIAAMIAKAARDPKIDIAKMERLTDLLFKIKATQAQTAYQAALAKMQAELPLIGQRGSIKNNAGGVQSRYALWEDIVTVITPILSKYGFAISFRYPPDPTGTGRIGVTGVLSHAEGHTEETTLFLPVDTSGSKNPVQAVGSSTSYGQRYTAKALLNLRTGEEDDDGRGGAADPKISESQVADLKALLTETGSNIPAFLHAIKADSLEDILAKNYEAVIDFVNAKKRGAARSG